MSRLIEIHVPVSAGVTRAQLAGVLREHGIGKVDVRRGPVSHTLQIEAADDLDPEAEGRLRADVAAVIGQAGRDKFARLEQRVAALEERLQRAGIA